MQSDECARSKVLLVAALLLANVAPALAQSSAPESSSADAQARALFREGQAAYEAGNYEQAFLHFRRAHELSPRPALLYNIGNAASEARRDEEALQALRAYLVADPDTRTCVETSRCTRDHVEARIRALEQRLQELRTTDDGEVAAGWVVLAGGVAALAGAIGSWLSIDGLQRDPVFLAYRMRVTTGQNVCNDAAAGQTHGLTAAEFQRVLGVCSDGSLFEALEYVFVAVAIAAAGVATTLLIDGYVPHHRRARPVGPQLRVHGLGLLLSF